MLFYHSPNVGFISQDNPVIDNLLIECLQQKTVLLIAFCVTLNPSNIWNSITYILQKSLLPQTDGDYFA